MCLGIFDFLCVRVGVYACQTLLTSPIWVVEDDMSGHCRLVVLEVGGVGRKRGEGRGSDVFSLTYHHIDIVCPVRARACVCVHLL